MAVYEVNIGRTSVPLALRASQVWRSMAGVSKMEQYRPNDRIEQYIKTEEIYLDTNTVSGLQVPVASWRTRPPAVGLSSPRTTRNRRRRHAVTDSEQKVTLLYHIRAGSWSQRTDVDQLTVRFVRRRNKSRINLQPAK